MLRLKIFLAVVGLLITPFIWISPSKVQAAQSPSIAPMVEAGTYHTCVLDAGEVKCWGWNNYGQLGLGDTRDRGDEPGEMGAALPAVDLGVGVTATAITAGRNHSCALLSSGAVKCWGDNGAGQLGLGDTRDRGDGVGAMGDDLPVVDLGTGVTATAISAGLYHTCALLTSGAVKCWGDNADGNLGLGDSHNRGDGADEMGDALPAVNLGVGVTATAISAGFYVTCALLSSGVVKCWGYNGDGELGLGDSNNRGDDADEMGDALPAVNLGVGVTATAVSVGLYHTCALLTSGAVKCWGESLKGELGLGDRARRGDEPGEMGDDLPEVDLGTGVTAIAISVRDYASCALLSSGAVKCWGDNEFGRLGLGDTLDRGDDPDEMGDDLPAVDLGTGVTATAITAGGEHTCALLSSGAVKCWGYNDDGQLGLGDRDNRGDGDSDGDGVGAMGDALVSAFQVTRFPQTITFDALPKRLFAAAPFTVTASSSLNLPVTLTSSTPTVCSTSGFEVTMLQAGVCSLTASHPGVEPHIGAAEVSQSFTVSGLPYVKKGRQSTLSSVARKSLLTVPRGAKVSGVVARASRSVCRVSGTRLVGVTPGRCRIKITVTPKTGSATRRWVVVNVSGSPTVRRSSSVSLRDAASAANMTTGTGLSIQGVVASSSKKVCKVSGSKIRGLRAGRCRVTVTVTSAGGATATKRLSIYMR